MSFSLFLNPRITLGLRLEILAGGILVGFYLLCKARRPFLGMIKGIIGYVAYYGLGIVLHPGLKGLGDMLAAGCGLIARGAFAGEVAESGKANAADDLWRQAPIATPIPRPVFLLAVRVV